MREAKSGEEPWDDEGRHIGDEAVRRRSLYGDELDPECPTWALRCVGSIHGKGRLSIGSRSIQIPVAPHLAKGCGREKRANRLPPSYPRRGRRHAHGPVFLEERNQPVNIVRLPGRHIAPQQLARRSIGGIQSHPRLLLRMIVRLQGDPGTMQGTVHGRDCSQEQTRNFARVPVQDIGEKQDGPLTWRERFRVCCSGLPDNPLPRPTRGQGRVRARSTRWEVARWECVDR